MVSGDTGFVQQQRRVFAAGRIHANADMGGDANLMARNSERFAQYFKDTLYNPGDRFRVNDVGQ